jgi:hypothetical protein
MGEGDDKGEKDKKDKRDDDKPPERATVPVAPSA